MHDKFLVVKGETVETSTFNFTAARPSRGTRRTYLCCMIPGAPRALRRSGAGCGRSR